MLAIPRILLFTTNGDKKDYPTGKFRNQRKGQFARWWNQETPTRNPSPNNERWRESSIRGGKSGKRRDGVRRNKQGRIYSEAVYK